LRVDCDIRDGGVSAWRASTGFYLFPMISLFFFSFYFPKYGRWEEWMKERVKSAGRIK
jgi:hypothetical protein